MREHHGPSHPTKPAAEPPDALHVGKATLAQPGDRTKPTAADVQRAVEQGHARRALQLMEKASPAEQAAIADAIGASARRAFAKHMPHDVGDAAPDRGTIQTLFDHTPDAEVATLELLLEARFRLNVSGDHHPSSGPERKFDALGLRRMWTVLQALPPDHVAHNWAVAKLERYHDTDDKDPNHAHGSFSYPERGAGEIDISYRDSIIEDGGTTDHDQPGDALHGVNRFDEVARHEVGHAVDRELGIPSYYILTKTAEAGHWEVYYDQDGYRKAAHEMVARSRGPIHHLPKAERDDVIDAMVHAMEHSTAAPFHEAIKKIHGHGDLESDAVYEIMTTGQAKHDPWKSVAALGGRHFHQAYAGTGAKGAGASWVSYDAAARKSHRVSEYQFRATQEWFAECYAAFYTPAEPGAPKGERLKSALPKTHDWFVQHVDNRRAVKRESKAARKYDGAPRKK